MIDVNDLIREAIEQMEATKHEFRCFAIYLGGEPHVAMWYTDQADRRVGSIQPTLGM